MTINHLYLYLCMNNQNFPAQLSVQINGVDFDWSTLHACFIGHNSEGKRLVSVDGKTIAPDQVVADVEFDITPDRIDQIRRQAEAFSYSLQVEQRRAKKNLTKLVAACAAAVLVAITAVVIWSILSSISAVQTAMLAGLSEAGYFAGIVIGGVIAVLFLIWALPHLFSASISSWRSQPDLESVAYTEQAPASKPAQNLVVNINQSGEGSPAQTFANGIQ